MAILNFFSYRKRIEEAGTPDVYSYDNLPHQLRVQVIHIWNDAVGDHWANRIGWQFIHDAVSREHGLLVLADGMDASERCQRFLLDSEPVSTALDIVEASCLYFGKIARSFNEYERSDRGIRVTADTALEELNERFRRAGVGYRYEAGQVVRVDSD